MVTAGNSSAGCTARPFWQAEAVDLRKQLAAKQEMIDALEQRLFGKKPEKMPRPDEALRKRGDVMARLHCRGAKSTLRGACLPPAGRCVKNAP